jgi:hypothetical protein
MVNQFRTAMLLVAMTLLVIFIGKMLGGAAGDDYCSHICSWDELFQLLVFR